MRTRGQHRAGAAALAGLALLAVGAAPAQADQPAPGKAPATQPTARPEAKQPKPVQDLTAPQRPTLGEANTEAGGIVRLGVQAEAGSALVVREGDKVVASASATGLEQTLSWKTVSGPHTFLVVATDAAGNASDGSPLTLDVDATPPSAKNFSVTPGTDRDSRSRWAVVTDQGTEYALLVDGKTVSEGTTQSRTIREYLDLADGRHDVELELRDPRGNLRTLTDSVAVDIPTLWVAAKAVSGPGEAEQVFKVAAPPATRGYLRIPGAGGQRFELTDGRAEVTIEVPEGSYEAPVVTVADALDRKGTTELAPFEVDLTAPALQVTTVDGAAQRGLLSAGITAGEGDTVTWRVIESDHDFAVLSGEFVADGTEQLLERELGEGSYELEVTATDANGNVSVERQSTEVAAKPLINPDVVPALTIALVLWVLVGLAVLLRRRGGRVRSFLGRVLSFGRGPRSRRGQLAAEHARQVAEYDEQRAVFEHDDRIWQQRRDDLAQLITVAQGGHVDLPETALELRSEERIYCALPAALVEMQPREEGEVPVEVDAGQLVVTNERVAFTGTTNRDWELVDVEQVRHLDHDRTMIKVHGQAALAGVSYADSDLVRLYLELAMANLDGDSRSVLMMLKQGMRQHELRRPQAPTPVATRVEPTEEPTVEPAPVPAVELETVERLLPAVPVFVGEQVRPGMASDDTKRELELLKS